MIFLFRLFVWLCGLWLVEEEASRVGGSLRILMIEKERESGTVLNNFMDSE